MTPKQAFTITVQVSVSLRARLEALKALRAPFTGKWTSSSALMLEAIENLLAKEGLSGRSESGDSLTTIVLPPPSPPDQVDPAQLRLDAHVRDYVAKQGAAGRNVDALRTTDVLVAMGVPVDPFKSTPLLRRVGGSLKRLGYRSKHTENGNVWVSASADAELPAALREVVQDEPSDAGGVQAPALP